jgi:hypothetical protein
MVAVVARRTGDAGSWAGQPPFPLFFFSFSRKEVVRATTKKKRRMRKPTRPGGCVCFARIVSVAFVRNASPGTGSFAPAFLWHFYGFQSDAFIPYKQALIEKRCTLASLVSKKMHTNFENFVYRACLVCMQFHKNIC